ncbi:MAG: hypothetical protein BMS9Abin04_030 [Planctomycetia bacterium]|nr:MAG: hypothetical protein BMS9Abin04_030 [Planctomycetia bacterium]
MEQEETEGICVYILSFSAISERVVAAAASGGAALPGKLCSLCFLLFKFCLLRPWSVSPQTSKKSASTASSVAWAFVRLGSLSVNSESADLVVWPRKDKDLSRFTGWLTLTHTQRWHAHRHSAGTGHVYQGRFKSFPVQSDEHFLTVCRYVERNALRANLFPRTFSCVRLHATT